MPRPTTQISADYQSLWDQQFTPGFVATPDWSNSLAALVAEYAAASGTSVDQAQAVLFVQTEHDASQAAENS